MTNRLWTDGTAGSVLVLSDEQALDKLERGHRIRPIEGAAKLTATLREEAACTDSPRRT